MKQNLEDRLRAYASSDAYAFHMPGHKRVLRNLAAEGADLYSYDITEIDGFDNLHDPKGILAEEMAFAARLYGVPETYFLVGGSTLGILAAVSAAAPVGGRILIERGCHISVYHAAHLRQLEVDYMEDPWNPPSLPRTEPGQEHGGRRRSYDAIVLTSPTYEGAIRPVSAWAAFARQMNAVLIIDEAHGAHLPFHPYFPSSAAANGADLVVQSLHKTLPALTQTALLHNVSGRVSGRKIQAFLDICETSSPSYLLLASITATLHALADGQGRAEEEKEELRTDSRGLAKKAGKPGDGRSGGSLPGGSDESPDQGAVRENLMESYVRRLKILRARLSHLRYFRLFGGAGGIAGEGELPGIPAGTSLDPGKIVILCRGSMDGPALYRTLREIFLLQPEMCGPDYVLCMTSAADTAKGFERLAAALEELDRDEQMIQNERTTVVETGRSEQEKTENSLFGRPLPPVACPIFEAAESEAEDIPIRDAAGRISAGYLLLYPPDAPLLVPGEIFTEEKLREIRGFLERGLTVIGVDARGCVPVTKIEACGPARV